MIIRGTKISSSNGTVEYRTPYGGQVQVVRIYGTGDHARIVSFFEKWSPDLVISPASLTLLDIKSYIQDAESRLSSVSESFPSSVEGKNPDSLGQ